MMKMKEQLGKNKLEIVNNVTQYILVFLLILVVMLLLTENQNLQEALEMCQMTKGFIIPWQKRRKKRLTEAHSRRSVQYAVSL